MRSNSMEFIRSRRLRVTSAMCGRGRSTRTNSLAELITARYRVRPSQLGQTSLTHCSIAPLASLNPGSSYCAPPDLTRWSIPSLTALGGLYFSNVSAGARTSSLFAASIRSSRALVNSTQASASSFSPGAVSVAVLDADADADCDDDDCVDLGVCDFPEQPETSVATQTRPTRAARTAITPPSTNECRSE